MIAAEPSAVFAEEEAQCFSPQTAQKTRLATQK